MYDFLQVIDVLECVTGCVMGIEIPITTHVFRSVAPILSELPTLLNMYNNYQEVVQLILEVFTECGRHMLINALPDADCKQLFEIYLATIQTYAKCNANRFSTEALSEENSFQDLLLVLEFLTVILDKDFFCFDADDKGDGLAASDISLFGLNFIMPLMKIELLNYPQLCNKYYKLISDIAIVHSDRICNLGDVLLAQLLQSVQLGLTGGFGDDVTQMCLDIIDMLVEHVFKRSSPESKVCYNSSHFLHLT